MASPEDTSALRGMGTKSAQAPADRLFSRQEMGLLAGRGVDVTDPSAVPPWQCGAIMAARARSHSLSCGTEQLSAPSVRAAGSALARWHRRFYGDWGTALGEGHSHQRASSSDG